MGKKMWRAVGVKRIVGEWRETIEEALDDAAEIDGNVIIESQDGEDKIPVYRMKDVEITKRITPGRPPTFRIRFSPSSYPDGVHEGEVWGLLYNTPEARDYINVGYAPTLKQVDKWTFRVIPHPLGS